MLWLVLILTLCGMTIADYDCLCSYNVETPVFSTDLYSSKKLGYMYEFDCKPILHEKGIDTTMWKVVAFEHQKGFVQLDPQTQIQTCPGNPSAADIITTQSPTSSSTPTTLSATSFTTSSKSSTFIPKTASSNSSTSSYSEKSSTTPVGLTNKPTTITSSISKSTIKTTAVPKPTKYSTTVLTKDTSKSTSSPSTKPPTSPKAISTSTLTSKTFTKQATNIPQTTRHSTSRQTSSRQSTSRPTPSRQTTPSTTTQIRTTVPTTTQQSTSMTTITTKGTASTTTQQTTIRPLTTPTSPKLTTTSIPLACPSNVISSVDSEHGYLERYGTSCYERVPHRRTWNAASDDCKRKGGYLVQIGSAQEDATVSRFLSNAASKYPVWIGLHDQTHEEVFTWTSGEPLSYTNWIPNRKSNYHNHLHEDCVVLMPNKQGMWDDISCVGYHVYPYICEYHISGSRILIGR